MSMSDNGYMFSYIITPSSHFLFLFLFLGSFISSIYLVFLVHSETLFLHILPLYFLSIPFSYIPPSFVYFSPIFYHICAKKYFFKRKSSNFTTFFFYLFFIRYYCDLINFLISNSSNKKPNIK